MDRAGARTLLERSGNGAFLVRPTRRGGSATPYALTLRHAGREVNLIVRRRPDGRFALGSEKPGEVSFGSMEELVQHHQREPLALADGALSCLGWYPPRR